MNPGSILLGVALLLVVGLVLARPFFVAHYRRQEMLTEREALEAQKEALLAQIRELDFDHETGKLPDAVHKQRRAELVAEAAAVLQRLDRLQPAAGKAADELPAPAEQEIEAAIARLRRVRAAAPQGAEGADEIEMAVAQLRGQAADGNGAAAQAEPTPTERSTGDGARFCPQCGQQRDADDNFCAYCGHHFA